MSRKFSIIRPIWDYHRAGFIDIRKEGFRQGRNQRLLIDAERHAYQSLYIEASTPSS